VPASSTRRRDLFFDAGFTDPDGALAALAQEVAALALPGEWEARTPEGGVAALAAYRVTRALVEAGSATTTDLLDAQAALTTAH